MRAAFVLALLVLAACDQQSMTTPPPDTQQPAAASAAAHNASAVEGWETNQESYAKLGATAPDFSTTTTSGELAVTQDALRGHWTIVGFGTTAGAEEARFVGALKSAVDQDPDLDFMAIEDTKAAETFAVEETPAYLLIGPDLTIEAYRGALSATPEDGIKPVIRGVAEIKRQIAAPL